MSIEEKIGGLCANVETILSTVKEMDIKLDSHHDRITYLENHNTMIKKACKWIGAGVGAVISFVAWVSS